MNKKKLLILALVVIMIATVSFSTLAWFTDVDSAKNDFTIGGAGTGDKDDIFSIDVKEKVDGCKEGQIVDEMKFENVLPGDEHRKEAYVENTGSYDQYVRVILTVSDWNLIKDIVDIKMDKDFAKNWHIVTRGVFVDHHGNLATDRNVALDDGKLEVVMYLDKILKPTDEAVQILDFVRIAAEATQEDFADKAFDDGFFINIRADAVQTENILDTPSAQEWQNAMHTFAALEN